MLTLETDAIYSDTRSRERFLFVLDDVVTRMRWRVHAYCLMTNHYHLLVETLDPNIGRGMERLNGIYARWSTGDMGTRATYSSGATTTSSSNAMRICLNSQRGGTTPNFIAAIDAH